MTPIELVVVIVLAIGLALAATYFYRRFFQFRVYRRFLDTLVLVGILLFAIAPAAWVFYDQSQDERRLQSQMEAFAQRYPSATMIVAAQQVPDTWVFDYLNEGERHTAIRIGNQWLDVTLPQ